MEWIKVCNEKSLNDRNLVRFSYDDLANFSNGLFAFLSSTWKVIIKAFRSVFSVLDLFFFRKCFSHSGVKMVFYFL